MNLTMLELKKPTAPYYFFEIAGEPVACERPRVTRFGSYLPEKSRKAEEAIAWAFRASFPGKQLDDTSLFGVRLRFFCDKPRKDTDNLQKLVFDALNKILWKDDRQIREVYCVVTANHRPRTEILIYRITEDYLAQCGESA